MKKLGCSLLLAAVWTLPLSADEPQVGPEVEVEVTPIEVVDPLPEGDLSILTFSSGIAEGGEVCPHEAGEHLCPDHLDGQCDHLAGECLHNLPLSADGPVGGEDLSFYSLASSSGVAAESGAPQMAFRNLDGAEHAAAAAVANVPAFSGGLLQENTLRANVPFGRETPAAAGAAQPGHTGMFGRLLARNTQPVPVTAADRDYALRLASIDQLRDKGLSTGNAAMLQQADRLEQELKGGAEKRGLRLFRR